MARSAANRKANQKKSPGLDRGWRLLLFSVALSLLLTAALAVPFLPSAVGPEVRAGFPAPYAIKSPTTTRYVSKILTEADREAAAKAVVDVYQSDASITVQARQSLSDTLGILSAVLADPELDEAGRQERIGELATLDLSTDTLALLVTLDERAWGAVRTEALRLHDAVTSDPLNPQGIRQIKAQDVEGVWAQLNARVKPTFPLPQRTLIVELVKQFIKPNYVIDQATTDQRRETARANTPDHYVQLLEGELIVYEGQIVRELDLEKMAAAGLRRSISWPNIAGQAVLVFGMVVTYTLYLYRFQEKIGQDLRELVLIGLVMVAVTLVGRFIVPGRVGFAYAFPLATAAIWLTLLLSPRVALGANMVLAVLVGMLGGNTLELAVLGLAGGLVAVIGIAKAQRSSSFLYTGFFIALTNIVVLGAFRLITYDLDLSTLLTAALACAINGFASAAFGFAFFGLLGFVFGRVTVLQLMELANPNHPLLHRLMQHAPGTYYHSIIVGNLAERAAEVVGADPLLVRVGAYFHDIGKVVRPYFFVDNQSGRSNIHDELPAKTSSQLITDHVRDGVALARKYRLPEKIVDFIPQHHGTTMATYFYRRALQEDETVDPEDFRYPGPPPQTREAAILMLADSVEATVRSMDQSGKLKEMLESSEEDGADPLFKLVDSIIEDRVRDGQLEDSDLTFRDLKAIRQAFVDMLRGVYHPRVVYPELGKTQEAGR